MSNPYHLRKDLLNQAQDILTHRFHAETDKLKYLCDTNKLRADDVVWPIPPSTEAVIAEAEKLFSFIQKK